MHALDSFAKVCGGKREKAHHLFYKYRFPDDISVTRFVRHVHAYYGRDVSCAVNRPEHVVVI